MGKITEEEDMKVIKKNKLNFKRVFFNILLIVGSCVLGTYSWIWLASIFLSSRTTLVTVKNMDVVVRSLFLFVLFVGGYVCLLLWLRKVRHRYFILVNIFLYLFFLFFTPQIPITISNIQVMISLPKMEQRNEIYAEMSQKLKESGLPYEINISLSEEYTMDFFKKMSVVVTKMRNGKSEKFEIEQLIQILPNRVSYLKINMNQNENVRLLLDETKKIMECYPSINCEAVGIKIINME